MFFLFGHKPWAGMVPDPMLAGIGSIPPKVDNLVRPSISRRLFPPSTYLYALRRLLVRPAMRAGGRFFGGQFTPAQRGGRCPGLAGEEFF